MLTISRAAFVRVLEASHGYVQRTARVLGWHRETVRLRLSMYGLNEHAAKLRAADRGEHLKVPKYRPDCTPAERLRWLEGINTDSMSDRARNNIHCARNYWRRRVKERAA